MATNQQQPARVGRPRILDEAKRREICALVSVGASLKTAAAYVGCSYVTLYRERQRDEEFATRLARARATSQLAPLQTMRQAAKTEWRAAAWLLERTDPDQFGRRRPHAFGAKELRALKRDLLDIFDEAINQPHLREQVSERMQATMNYAMHHAWDSRRSGNPLRRAMQLFDPSGGAQQAVDFRTPHERMIDELLLKTEFDVAGDGFESSTNPNLSISSPPGAKPEHKHAENPDPFDSNGASSP